MKVLCTAKDVGSAGHILEVLRCARRRLSIELVVCAQSSALNFFKIVDDPAVLSVVGAENCAGSSNSMFEFASKLMIMQTPDAVLTGISHDRDIGIDEAVVYSAKGRVPTFSVQDYWGYVHNRTNVHPDVYFVMDDIAASLTKSRVDSEIEIVGSAKHAPYGRVDWGRIRAELRATVLADPNTLLIGYFGQALHRIEGYQRILHSVACAVQALPVPNQLIYRPHPREAFDEVQATMLVFQCSGLMPTLCAAGRAEPLLAACDLVLSCFSTCGHEALLLSRHSSVPLANVLYVLTEPDVRTFMTDVTGTTELPDSIRSLARTIYDDVDLVSAMADSVSISSRAETQRRVCTTLSCRQDSGDMILDTIEHLVLRSGL